jgi:tetratricopeptide (TPR) repeat protein
MSASKTRLTTLLALLLTVAAGSGSASAASSASVDAPRAITASEAISTGQTLLSQARLSSDPAVLVKAEQAFRQAVELEPANADAHIGLATVALSRHHFAEALEIGRAARELAPDSARPLGVLFDALIELGRYGEARDVIETMLMTRPDLASLSRLSYYHELHGQLELAIEAMERAVVAGSTEAEHTAFARTVLGHLWLLDGDASRAQRFFDEVLTTSPGYVPALVGSARASAASGDLISAKASLQTALSMQREPAVMVQLGEVLAASDDVEGAAEMFGDAVVTEAAHRATGEAPEPFGAVLEADHGDARLALMLAERAYAHAPSIGSADALAWASFRVGDLERARSLSDEALRTGSLDPQILYHAGVIAAADSEPKRAAGLLRAGVEHSAAGSPGLRAALEEALAAVDVGGAGSDA